jgi:hypothetical protein
MIGTGVDDGVETGDVLLSVHRSGDRVSNAPIASSAVVCMCCVGVGGLGTLPNVSSVSRSSESMISLSGEKKMVVAGSGLTGTEGFEL